MMAKLTVEDVALRDQRVLMRVDFNVPIHKGKVTNDRRIRAALPTIRYVLDKGGRLILMSHLGRPKGERRPEMSLKPCADALAHHLDQPIAFIENCVGNAVTSAVAQLVPGQALLLENLRFHAAETNNDPIFAKQLADLADVYINDAFGTAHRAHASTVGVAGYLQPAAAGFLMMKELKYLGGALQAPQRPFVAILGGAKISGKIDVIQKLLTKVDRLLIGGGMAYTFFYAQGLSVGNSLLESDKAALARSLLHDAGDKIVLPVDCMASNHFDFSTGQVGPLQTVGASEIPDGFAGLDIGPASIERFKMILSDAQTVVWNGPMGVFEIDATARGTFAIARLLAQKSDAGAVTIIGGGDSAAAAEKSGVAERISHISTGGGASLEFLEGKALPGISALTDK